jgi:hypothetical protein
VYAAPYSWTVVRSITVKGSYVGNREDARQALDIAARGRVRTTYRVEPLDKLPEVFQEMKEGRLAGRVVLDLVSANIYMDSGRSIDQIILVEMRVQTTNQSLVLTDEYGGRNE